MAAGNGITSESVFVMITLSRPGNSRSVDSGRVQTDADPEWIRVSKKLFESPAYNNIVSKDTIFSKRIREVFALPCPIAKKGMYLIPHDLVGQVVEYIRQYAEEDRPALIDEFLKQAPDVQAEAPACLRSLSDPADNSPTEALAEEFKLEWSIVDFATPTSLKKISSTLYEAERKKAAEKWQQASEHMITMLRLQFLEIISHAHSKLEPELGADGKPVRKHFKAALLERMDEFFACFDSKNMVVKDSELPAIIEEARAILKGIPAGEAAHLIQSDSAIKENAAKAFGAVKAKLEALVENTPKRALSFSDDI